MEARAGALYAVLSVARLREMGSIPIGIVLLNPIQDQLYVRFRRDFSKFADEEAVEVLEGLAEWITTRALEEGATRVFGTLLDSFSNHIRIDDPCRLAEPSDWAEAVDRLFIDIIMPPGSSTPAGTRLPS